MKYKAISALLLLTLSLSLQACSVSVNTSGAGTVTNETSQGNTAESSGTDNAAEEDSQPSEEVISESAIEMVTEQAEAEEDTSAATSTVTETATETSTVETTVKEEATAANTDDGTIDPFAKDVFNVADNESGVVLSFTGASPYIFLTVRNNISSFNSLSEFVYSADKTQDIKEGDTVTVSVSAPTVTWNKHNLSRTSIEIPVEGMDSYVTSISEITDADWDQIMVDVNKYASQFGKNGRRRKSRTLVYDGIINNEKQQFFLNESGFTLSGFGYKNAHFSSLDLAGEDVDAILADNLEYNRLTIELVNTVHLTNVLYAKLETEMKRSLTQAEKDSLDLKTGYRAIQLFNIRRNANGKLLYDIQKYGWGSTYTDENRMLSKAVMDVETMQTKDISSYKAIDYCKPKKTTVKTSTTAKATTAASTETASQSTTAVNTQQSTG